MRLFNQTIKRNSDANPGFTAGFAVPLNIKRNKAILEKKIKIKKMRDALTHKTKSKTL